MRPELTEDLFPEDFLRWYWLREELTEFCRVHQLPRNGDKADLTTRIHEFLATGEIPKKPTGRSGGVIAKFALFPDSPIPENCRCSEELRAFFKKAIGEHFKFNVPFMNWLKENSGKTFAQAADEWQRLAEEKKRGIKREISPQFEYNQYTRDFFEDNPEAARKACLACWKYKRSLPGHNRYEISDLNILEKNHEQNNQHNRGKHRIGAHLLRHGEGQGEEGLDERALPDGQEILCSQGVQAD